MQPREIDIKFTPLRARVNKSSEFSMDQCTPSYDYSAGATARRNLDPGHSTKCHDPTPRVSQKPALRTTPNRTATKCEQDPESQVHNICTPSLNSPPRVPFPRTYLVDRSEVKRRKRRSRLKQYRSERTNV
eukprot:scpid57912/ scgid21083/ 